VTSNGAGLFLKNKVEVLDKNDVAQFVPDLKKNLDLLRTEFVKQYGLVTEMLPIEDSGKDKKSDINSAITALTKIKVDKDIINALMAKKKSLSKAGKKDTATQIGIVKEEQLASVQIIDGVNVIAQKIELDDSGAIKDLAFQLKAQVENMYLVLGAAINGKPNLTIVVSEELSKAKDLHAGNIIREAAKEMRGGGGGQPFYATAGGSNIDGIEAAIEKAKSFL
ncbi:MAG: DHHA1 domain-containing protein, partial [Vicingaceae bacterium]